MTAVLSRRWAFFAAGGVGAALSCLIAAVVMLSMRQPEFHSHYDTVGYLLRQRGVSYRQITFQQSFEESMNIRVYSAAVQVELSDGRVANGWIGCENGNGTCFLVLRSVGIRGDRLPEWTNGRHWAWQDWLDRAERWIGQYQSSVAP